ncbi:hypothetical protein CCB81_02325 [Armatimonadetes bacterium Uphvl-Ar2]|nr:hypothetical protein CCB81_02325 [Armatimonadetes bacterium Uphvl-Ar2]
MGQGTMSPVLTPEHRRELEEGSGIASEVITSRGYRSVRTLQEFRELGLEGLPSRVPGLLIPIVGVGREAAQYQFKPDHPRTNDGGKVIKYESPSKRRVGLDLHAFRLNPEWAEAIDVPLWITEGVKKVDCGLSRGLCVVGVQGVWNWQKGRVASPEWGTFRLEGREVRIVFDSDAATNRQVRQAEESMAEFLREQGARVKIIRLPCGTNGKVGLDDYFVQGGSVQGLEDFAVGVEDASRVSLVRLCELQIRTDFDWLVDGLIPAGDLTVISAKPKVGKSTLARAMCGAVSLGSEFLGRSCKQGAVAYLAYEDQVAAIRSHFESLHAPDVLALPDPGQKCEATWLSSQIERHQLRLVVIDTLFRGIAIRDGNDYAGVVRALDPIQNLARETGCGIVVTHHDRKGDGSDAGDSTLGSQGIFGTASTLISLQRDSASNRRTIRSVQRYGTDIEPTELIFDGSYPRLGRSRAESQVQDDMSALIAFVQENPDSGREDLLAANVVAKSRLTKVIDAAIGEGLIIKTMSSARGNPYTLRVPA